MGQFFLGDFCFSDLDLFFWFGEIDRNLDSYHIKVLETISKKTKVINNPKALKIGLDKYYSQSICKKKGVPTPKFFLVTNKNVNSVKKTIEKKQFIIKPRLGSFGSGIMKISDYQNLIDIMDYSNIDSHFLEEFIDYNPKDWIGINVIGGKIAYAYGKQASKFSDWKVFDRDRKGGKMILKTPLPEQKKIALAVGKATGLEIFGVDIIKSRKGKNYVIDVNTFPGLYPNMFSLEKIDGVKLFIDLLKSKL